MSLLGEGLSRFFGRVEILARGAESHLRAAEVSLERGDVLEARAQARALLARVPESPLGLAIWADAAEACGFHDEVVEALEQLAAQVPWQQEIWLRLGNAGLSTGWTEARRALERAAAGRDDPGVSRAALFRLADLDIAAGEHARATRWLERVPNHPSQSDAPLAIRRAECAVALGRWEEARSWMARAAEVDEAAREELGGRWRILRARIARRWPDESHGSDALSLALGAWLLDARGADVLLAELIAESDDAALCARAREAIVRVGRIDEPRWQAAFALAEGRRADALGALLEAARAGDAGAADVLLAHAVRWRDIDALGALAEERADMLPADVALLLRASRALAGDEPAETGEARGDELALELIEQAWSQGGEAEAWAAALIGEVVARWVPAGEETSRWEHLLRELRRGAALLERRHASPGIEALALERDRPLYVAILGEFNAGKSTLINALLGIDVAPTGVRPTTASLHWVAWAPDPFARVVVRGGVDRVVPHTELKPTLTAIRKAGEVVDRVFIYAPIERLKRIEILDTPGFNAPEQTHAEEAHKGIEEAHVALWLLDATAPLKHSERLVIERVAAAGVPIQVLVNKRDRLAPADLERVMGYVHQALRETAIVSLAPPLALSAQLALSGRLGDEAALARSGWPELEAFLADQVVNVSDRLRERALRRKAARIAAALAETADERARAQLDARNQERLRAEAIRAFAARLRSERAALAERMAAELGDALAHLAADVAPVDQLAEGSRNDPEVRAYVIDKTAERLAPVIGEAVRRLGAGTPGLDLRAIGDRIHAVIAGAAAAYGERPPLAGEPLRAAVEVALLACAGALEAPPTSLPVAHADLALALRMRAVQAALSPKAAC